MNFYGIILLETTLMVRPLDYTTLDRFTKQSNMHVTHVMNFKILGIYTTCPEVD